MEWVSLLLGEQVKVEDGVVRVDWDSANAYKTDEPTCTNHTVTVAAITVNDWLEQEHRDQLAALLPRLIRAVDPEDFQAAYRVQRRLRLWLLDRALAATEGELSEAGRALLEAVREAARLGVSGFEELNSTRELARRLASVRKASERDLLLHEHWDSLAGDGLLDRVLLDLKQTGDPRDALRFLEDLLDQLDKAKAEEGLLGDDPEPLYLSDEEMARVVEELS